MAWDAAILDALGPRAPRLAWAIETALDEDRPADAAALMCEAGDALANLGLAGPTLAAFEAAYELAEGKARRLAGDLAWRLGEVREVLNEPGLGADWYERAAESYGSVGADADQVASLQAAGRLRLLVDGAQAALRILREAVAIARATGEELLLAGAMEQVADAAFEMNLYDDAAASYREAARLFGAGGDSAGFVRATIGTAECALAEGEHVRGIQLIAPVEADLEMGQDDETRGRGLGLVALFQLEAGEREAAATNFEEALGAFERAGATLRRARLMLTFGRAIERLDGPAAAIEMFRAALALYRRANDRARVAPAAYAAARCYAAMGQLVQADELIELALDVSQTLGDLEGLEICTRLAVKVAVQMGQGKLALDRMRLAARIKGELGDYRGEVRYLMRALEAVLAVPEMEAVRLADEFLEALHRTGTAFLTPDEVMDVAEKLATAGRPGHAKELLALLAASEAEAARFAEAAEAFAAAARYAVQDDTRDEAGDLWDQAIAIGERYGLPPTADWRVDRATFGVAR